MNEITMSGVLGSLIMATILRGALNSPPSRLDSVDPLRDQVVSWR